MYHFPIADPVNDLTLPKSCAEGIQGIQLTLVHPRPGTVKAGNVECVREDDAKGGAEGRNHVYPRQVGRGSQVIQCG